MAKAIEVLIGKKGATHFSDSTGVEASGHVVDLFDSQREIAEAIVLGFPVLEIATKGTKNNGDAQNRWVAGLEVEDEEIIPFPNRQAAINAAATINSSLQAKSK